MIIAVLIIFFTFASDSKNQYLSAPACIPNTPTPMYFIRTAAKHKLTLSRASERRYNHCMQKDRLEPYEFRAAYLAAGPNVAKAIEESFRPLPVDEVFIRCAAENIEALAETNINFIIYPFDLGFPPEESVLQRESFHELSTKAPAFGMQTVALITTSSYYPRGTYKNASWTARLPNGKPIQYSHNSKRMMACWADPEWTNRLETIARESIEAGASGVMLDPVFFGAAPLFTDGGFEGPAGCFCKRCREKFKSEHVSREIKYQKIPVRASLDDDIFKAYTKWRSAVVTESLERIRFSISRIDGSALFGIIAPHLTYYPTQIMYGLDPEWALSAPDVCLIEHHGHASLSREGLAYGLPALKLMRSASRGPLAASIAYSYGPSNDTIHAATGYSAMIAEAFSCGCAPVIRAGEYRGTGDVLGDFITNEDYSDQRNAISSAFNWIEKNPELFENTSTASTTGVLFSLKRLQLNPHPFVSHFYKIVHTLTETQVPVELLVEETISEEDVAGLRVIIIPEAADIEPDVSRRLSAMFEGRKILYTGAKPGWIFDAERINHDFFADKPKRKKQLLSNTRAGRFLLSRFYRGGTGLFGGFPISPRAGIPPMILPHMESTRYLYPPPDNWKILRDATLDSHKEFPEDIVIQAPPYIHINEWKSGADSFFHIVNILPGLPGPDQAALRFPVPMNARVIDAFSNKITYLNNEHSIVVKPKPYAIAIVKNRYDSRHASNST